MASGLGTRQVVDDLDETVEQALEGKGREGLAMVPEEGLGQRSGVRDCVFEQSLSGRRPQWVGRCRGTFYRQAPRGRALWGWGRVVWRVAEASRGL